MLVFGNGIVNTLINRLPIELHIPGYQYCGPGTRLKERLARGDPGINPLDKACKEHDISYSVHKDVRERHKADKVLEERAWERVKAKNADFGEKTAAWMVTNMMKIKRRLGMGLKRKTSKIAFRSGVVLKAKEMVKKARAQKDLEKAIRVALKAAKESVRAAGGKTKVHHPPRIIPVSHQGGFLPLVPLLSGLSAIGGLSGGIASIVKAVKDIKRGREELEEAKRHNRSMEAIAVGKQGSGLYLKPYRKGCALYLSRPKKN